MSKVYLLRMHQRDLISYLAAIVLRRLYGSIFINAHAYV